MLTLYLLVSLIFSMQEYHLITEIGRGVIDEVWWSPDGQTIAVTTIRGVWFYQARNLNLSPRFIPLDYGELPEDRPPLELPFPRYAKMPRIAFDATWERMAVAEYEGGITIRDTVNGEVLQTLNPHHYHAMTFSPDGSTLVAARQTYNTAEIDLWDLQSGEITRQFSFDDRKPPRNMLFSPDARFLAVSAAELGGDYIFWTFYVVDLERGEAVSNDANLPPFIVARYSDEYLLGFGEGEFQMLDGALIAMTPDGSRYAAFDQSTGEISVYTAGESQPEFTHDLEGMSLWNVETALSPDGKRLVIAERNGTITVHGLEYEIIRREETSGCANGHVSCISMSSFHDLSIPELDLVTNQSSYPIERDQLVSPNRRWLLSTRGTIELVNLSQETSFILETGEENTLTVDGRFSPDNHWLALAFSMPVLGGSLDTVVRVWDISTDNPSATPAAVLEHHDTVLTIALSADSQLFASATVQGDVYVWNTENWSLVDVLPHPNDVTRLMFSEHDLITFSNDGVLRLWSSD